jgi:hypothetical protein
MAISLSSCMKGLNLNTWFSLKKKRVYDLPAQYSNQFVVPSQDPCENPSMTKKIKQLSNFRDEKDL